MTTHNEKVLIRNFVLENYFVYLTTKKMQQAISKKFGQDFSPATTNRHRYWARKYVERHRGDFFGPDKEKVVADTINMAIEGIERDLSQAEYDEVEERQTKDKEGKTRIPDRGTIKSLVYLKMNLRKSLAQILSMAGVTTERVELDLKTRTEILIVNVNAIINMALPYIDHDKWDSFRQDCKQLETGSIEDIKKIAENVINVDTIDSGDND